MAGAVADLKLFKKEFKLQGFFAWFIWMFIHLISIVGFRNRLAVVVNWAWNYFTFNSDNRLIVGHRQDNVPVAETITHKTGM